MTQLNRKLEKLEEQEELLTRIIDFVADRMAFSSVKCLWCSISGGRHTLLARLKASMWSLSATTESVSRTARFWKVILGAHFGELARSEGSGCGLRGGLGGRVFSSSSTKRSSVSVVRARLFRREDEGCWVRSATTVSWGWLVGGTSAGCVSVKRALTLFLFAISSSSVVRTRLICGKFGSGSGEASNKKFVTLDLRRLLYR